jgi:hypothetical protein
MPEVKYFFLICLFTSLFFNSEGIAEEPEKLSFFHETWNIEDGLAQTGIFGFLHGKAYRGSTVKNLPVQLSYMVPTLVIVVHG